MGSTRRWFRSSSTAFRMARSPGRGLQLDTGRPVFLFGSAAGNGAHDIFALPEFRGLLHKQTDKPIRLTFGPLRFETPLASLDGKKIFVFGWHQRGELVRYDSASRQFVPLLDGISASDVSFSRDGQWIAYVTLPGYELWRSRVDGSDRLQLISSSGNTLSQLPRWSPDGKQIAFISESHGGKALEDFPGLGGRWVTKAPPFRKHPRTGPYMVQ